MTNPHLETDYDAVVVGAGFAGIYQLYTLREELGLRVRLFEKGSGIGGTWFWNKYPGAMSDTESPFYRYSFDKELLQEWSWSRKYIDQPDILAYLEEVVRRHDLLKDIQLDSEITSIVLDEATDTWTVTTGAGESFTARYVVTALGLLAAVNVPDIPGIDTFQGTLAHTAEWPDDLTLEGKRVGVIGTGSTGTQFIVAASKKAEHLTVFQRNPQYCVPSGNGPVEPGEVDSVKARYDDIWKQVRGSQVAFGFEESTVPASSVTPEERERVFEEAWARGNGFYFMFGTFNDLAVDLESNEAAADFIRRKIAQTVTDPDTARKLTPTQAYAKRPLCNLGYYEVYNQENVELVALLENPIVEIVPEGVRTADGVLHELDVLVLATGFDAVDGNYRRIDVVGRGGVTADEHWRDAPTSYLGIATTGFPNMFMVLGPNGPFTNLVPSIEVQVEFITKLVETGEREQVTIETTQDVEDGWSVICKDIADGTVFPKTDSWIFGANIPGKKSSVLFYMAGISAYSEVLAEVAGNGFKGFTLTPAARPVEV
ncbi:NAD(P)/FAD-dependent oxidoreductase [Rathayibacter sp. VKM Ac-2929]|uniref:flavin-containing monooxygenase n=1 Tax=Rathayibacter sp. VKM Ac-2929 TaxID=2929480 RepID=UPI001FB20278|nr:NAD(P)/FAD-dependent oxidoreductase [Rathayibacter sp. VKM Ac-2929]MCJ1675502.1 NAD(P)/FAD-dependent oxidoreductase [Rathayibacter sp. VKM Ac-2929]